MTERARSTPLDALSDFLVEDILAEKEADVLAEFRELGGDPEAHAEAMRELTDRLLLVANKSRLAAARAGATLSRTSNSEPNAPLDISVARQRLRENIEGDKPLSLAARKETHFSDSDIFDIAADLQALEDRSGDQARGFTANIRPDALLKALGVTEPKEIDLEAIAFSLRAQIQYRQLDGCDARIVGYGNDSIITINQANSERRQRFSIAHELGHWLLHRGLQLVCSVDETSFGEKPWSERQADRFAADLLLPLYIFEPLARSFGKLSLGVASELANQFQTSLTSTAIRLVEIERSAAFLVCHGLSGRKWYQRALGVPERWHPKLELAPESPAMATLFGRQQDDWKAKRVKATAWFDSRRAEGYFVYEQSARVGKDQILTLVVLDEAMVSERSR